MRKILFGAVALAGVLAAAPAFADWDGPADVAGDIIGGAVGAATGYGYGYGYGPDYGYSYRPAYRERYEGPVYEGRSVAVEPAYRAGGSVAYCESRFRSYNPRTGTYLGYDGLHHPCP
ncbi:MAG TPA: BA14K family protein [Beijerinckiaceae bacterium]|nr:BA14K family protein [Beijerinckiaceae bacterium]